MAGMEGAASGVPAMLTNPKAPARLQALPLAHFRCRALARFVSTFFTSPIGLSVATMNFRHKIAAPASARTSTKQQKCLLAEDHASLACQSNKP